MSKAVIVPDLAFTSRKGRRGGRSSGYKELKAVLKYLQYRDNSDGHIPQEAGLERWQDRGLGMNYREILQNCDQLGSNSVLAWTLVVSPAPDLMALVPGEEREGLVMALTEQIVEAYYTARGVDVAEYSYVLHDRLTDDDQLHQLHTHVVLPGTVPTVEGARQNFYNRANKGHIQLLQGLSAAAFETALDQHVGPAWRELRKEPVLPVLDSLPVEIQSDALSELDEWFGPRHRGIDR